MQVQPMVPYHARNMHTLIAKKVVLPLGESLIILDRGHPAQTREACGRVEIAPSSKNFLPPSSGFIRTQKPLHPHGSRLGRNQPPAYCDFSIDVAKPAMPPFENGRTRDRVRKQTLPQSTGTKRGGLHPSDQDLSLGTPGGTAFILHMGADCMSFRRKITQHDILEEARLRWNAARWRHPL
jgi:hypothetical protein